MESTSAISQDSKTQALLIWILTIFFGFIPGLVFFLLKKDDEYVLDQATEALNWSVTAILGYIAGFILSFIVVGALVILAVTIATLVFCIMGAIATSSGKPFRVPFAIRFIK